jgi:four helix bundle protein
MAEVLQGARRMTPKELKDRTSAFARDIVAYCTPLLDSAYVRKIADQLLRAGTAVNANYGSAQCGRSHDDFTAKIGQVWDDANESYGWLVLLRDGGVVPKHDALLRLTNEAHELTKIFAAAFRTAKQEQARRREAKRQETAAKRRAR